MVRIDVVSSANPEFNGAEQTVYGHTDQIGGAGSHSGYSTITLKSGEKLWTKYEGVHHRVRKADTWETRVQGISRFIAGTGNYKAIRGGSYYQGVTTPVGYTQDCMRSGILTKGMGLLMSQIFTVGVLRFDLSVATH